MKTIFLEENRSVFSNNIENSLDIGFSRKTRLLPNDNLSDTFSLFEQYNRERDECNRFRVILGLNPVCSNVLFNSKSEIMIKEGSDECRVILDDTKSGLDRQEFAGNTLNETTPITYYQAIRDTEYSHERNGGFIYHCGSDIFNNHLIRAKSFAHVCKMSTNASNECRLIYNTICDYLRDNEGDIVRQDIGIKLGSQYAGKETNMHLYQYDTIQSMEQAFSEKCSEKDGWWGFTNPGNIEIPTNSGNTIMVNRMMSDKRPCEFIDLYPDRSMFSFVPNFNNYRRRIERNWDLCITYPYEADYKLIDEICSGQNQAVRASIKYTVSNASTPMLECSTWFKHNLKVGDYVNFYYYLPHYRIAQGRAASASNIDILTMVDYKFYLTDTLDSDGSVNNTSVIVKEVEMDENENPKMDFHRMNAKVRVVSVGDANGDHTDKVFSVRFADVQGIYEYIKFFGCFYKKNVSNTECQYYFRKLKKLKNSEGEALRYDINKSAFGLNIYGDDVAQAVFIDDVDLTGLMDHNGRPVSEIYLTVVKRNQGHVEWYENNIFNTEDIEYSHCFGKVTAGIDFSGIEDEPFDYNVHYLHNMDLGELGGNNTARDTSTASQRRTFDAWGDTVIDGKPKVIEDDVTIDFDEFYGDVVEYDVANAKETVIGDLCYRVNTAQRETWNSAYMSTYQDILVSDDYDQANGNGKEWECVTYYLNDVESSRRVVNRRGKVASKLMHGNISPEGYFYKAHIPIRVREDDDDCTASSAKYINYANPRFSTGGTYTVQHADGTTTVYENKATALANTNTANGDVLYEENQYYQLVITVPVDYGFYKGDYMAFYNSATTELTWGEIMSVSGLELTLKFDYDAFATIDNVGERHFKQGSADRVLYAYWSTDNVPLYAKLSMGQRKFVWRKIVPPSEMIQDDELYNTPFTNGCFYLEKNVNFFLKRQDPTGKYGLSVPMYRRHAQTVSNPMQKFTVAGYDPVDLTEIATIVNNALTTCY